MAALSTTCRGDRCTSKSKLETPCPTCFPFCHCDCLLSLTLPLMFCWNTCVVVFVWTLFCSYHPLFHRSWPFMLLCFCMSTCRMGLPCVARLRGRWGPGVAKRHPRRRAMPLRGGGADARIEIPCHSVVFLHYCFYWPPARHAGGRRPPARRASPWYSQASSAPKYFDAHSFHPNIAVTRRT